MITTRHCYRCGQEFTENGFHLMCPRCRKQIEREKKRVADSERKVFPEKLNGDQLEIEWWIPRL